MCPHCSCQRINTATNFFYCFLNANLVISVALLHVGNFVKLQRPSSFYHLTFTDLFSARNEVIISNHRKPQVFYATNINKFSF